MHASDHSQHADRYRSHPSEWMRNRSLPHMHARMHARMHAHTHTNWGKEEGVAVPFKMQLLTKYF